MFYDINMTCPKCNSNLIVKNGIQNKNQRYKCKNCTKIFCIKNSKYSNEFKIECIHMYLESMGIRGISRVKKVHNSNISYWIKKAGKIAEEEFKKKSMNITKKDIAVVEIDELCTYVKKNLLIDQKTKPNIHLYGLLWNETQVKFLILKQGIEVLELICKLP
jgi:transposase-like protein